MNLLQQIIQLLSETPGNLVYHLVTLFALQAVFGISYSRWRRARESKIALRGAIAAGGILAARVLLLLVSLVYADSPIEATAVLPLLEQAVNTVSVAFIVWALVPHSERLPHLGDVLLLMGLLVIGAMYASFAQAWRELAAAGQAYNSSAQATVWALLQIALLGGGFILSLLKRAYRNSLSPLILALLLLAHLAHLWNYPELIPTETNITYWVRLGYLVVLPLWAVMAYRQSLLPLIAVAHASRSPLTVLEQAYRRAAVAIDSGDETDGLDRAVALVAAYVEAPFVAVGKVDAASEQLTLVSNQPQTTADQSRRWQLALSDWSLFEAAILQRRSLALQANGPGAGQLQRLADVLEVGAWEALFVQPLFRDSEPQGVVLLAQREAQTAVSEQDKVIAAALSHFLVQLLAESTRPQPDTVETTAAPRPEPVVAETAVRGRIIALEEERDRLSDRLAVARNRLQQAESRAVESSKRAHDLAATLDEMERFDTNERVQELERENEALRESLIEAEEAMAMASAGEGGLSTEWVMLTITRYSGQLEEAQSRIVELEELLARRDDGPMDEVLISVIQELRTPMTSIAGFTELLLGESVGILGVRQRDLLQRVRANVERMDGLLDQVVQLATHQEKTKAVSDEMVDVREVIETAVSGVITQVREKRLRLDLDIADNLPPLPVNRRDLHQIVINLLGNACQASESDGSVTVTARADAITIAQNGDGNEIRFVELAVRDSGVGIAAEDRPRVFAPHHRAEAPLIAGVGDTGAGLAMAHQLAEANGGRIWVESEAGVGSTFSVLFPVDSDGENGAQPAGGE